MTRILGISGSLRAGSFNTALLHAAQEEASGSEIEFDAATLHGIPLYDGDAEARDGEPEAVAALKQRILASDGVLLVTPEYNNGVPGVFKNGIDWLSRADMKAIFAGRPTGILGASMSGFGTLSSQHAWLPTLKLLGVQLFSGRSLMVSRAQNLFTDGRLQDDATRQMLGAYVADFAAFVAVQKAQRAAQA